MLYGYILQLIIFINILFGNIKKASSLNLVEIFTRFSEEAFPSRQPIYWQKI